MQFELVPKIQDQDRSENGGDYAAGMKSTASARRIKKMRYRSAYDRADNPEHNCPQDRQMRMQQRFRNAARKETDNDVPDKMKHSSS